MANHFKDPEFLKKMDQARKQKGRKTMTADEVSSHCTDKDLFITIDNVVYDVTKFQKEHPGGVLSISAVAGKDATSDFLAENHSRYAVVSKLPQCYVADLDKRELGANEACTAGEKTNAPHQASAELNMDQSLSCPDPPGKRPGRLSSDAVYKIFSSHAEMFELPGLAWLVREEGGEPITGACGVRRRQTQEAGREEEEGEERGRHGKKEDAKEEEALTEEGKEGKQEEALTGGEVFHWGSCSKALTATLILILIEDPAVELDWHTQVGQALPQLAISEEEEQGGGGAGIGGITVWQLLTHRSGLLADLGGAAAEDSEEGGREEAALAEASKGMTATAARLEYARRMAQKALAHAPGTRYGPYSNAGYTILGAMAEAVTGVAWEELAKTRVAAPLGMTSLGFGFPRGPGGIVAHDEEGAPVAAEAEDVRWHAPAYTCHATLADWGKLAGVHLAALRGERGAGTELGLRDGALEVLHTPASPAKDGEGFDGAEGPEGYAMGWKTQWREAEGGVVGAAAARTGVLWHYGTNFFFNSAQYLDAPRGVLVLAAANSGSMCARLAMRMAIDALLELLDEEG